MRHKDFDIYFIYVYIYISVYISSLSILLMPPPPLKQPDLFISFKKQRPGTGSMNEDPTQLATTSAARCDTGFLLMIYVIIKLCMGSSMTMY